jgi:hypothetical protein
MPIVLYLGKDIKEYESESKNMIERKMTDGDILCEFCTKAMARHSSYNREIKETGEEIEITMVWCRPCSNWHSLQPDFWLPCKHYSGNEIEAVIIDSATDPISNIDTKASASTVKRWITQIGERISQAINKLKGYMALRGSPISELEIEPGIVYYELEQVLEHILARVFADLPIKCCGNKLGLANILLRSAGMPALI